MHKFAFKIKDLKLLFQVFFSSGGSPLANGLNLQPDFPQDKTCEFVFKMKKPEIIISGFF